MIVAVLAGGRPRRTGSPKPLARLGTVDDIVRHERQRGDEVVG